MLIQYVYVVFMGILLAAFVGVGIAAFYKGPTYPEYPTTLKYQEPSNASMSAEQREVQSKYDGEFKQYQKLEETYNKNVSIIAIVASIVMLIVSLTLFKQILIIADGTLLGGVLTLSYGIIRGFGSNDDMFRFLVVSAGLIVALVLGYIKFVKPQEKS